MYLCIMYFLDMYIYTYVENGDECTNEPMKEKEMKQTKMARIDYGRQHEMTKERMKE